MKTEEPDRLGAASLSLRALMCAPYDSTIAQSVLAKFINWGSVLASEGRHEEALRALAFGYEVTQDSGIKNDLKVTALKQIASLIKGQKDLEAKAAIELATRLLPDEADFKNAEPWVRSANNTYQEEGGDAALLVIARALAFTDEIDHENLRKGHSSVIGRWSQDLLEQSDVPGSLGVLVRGYKFDPSAYEIDAGIKLHTQEALVMVDKDGADPAAAVAHFRLEKSLFPTVEAVTEFALSHAYRAVDSMSGENRFAEAIAAAGVYTGIADSTNDPQQLVARAWKNWASDLAEQKMWPESITKCLEGLKAVPNNELLTNSALIAIDELANISMESADWDRAIAIYDEGLRHFIDNGHLKDNRNYCVSKKEEAAKN